MLKQNKHNLKWFISCIYFIVLPVFCFAQDLKFKRLSNEAGLSQVTVQAIYEDSQGFMWIGTQDGLNRYDGYHFKVFKNNPTNKNSISSNNINCITEDVDGQLYIGTQTSGLSVYNRYSETFTNYKPSLKKSSISSPSIKNILPINNNELLIGTEKGLNIFNKTTKSFEVIALNNSSNDFYINKLFKTSTNKILVLAPRFGIYEYNPVTKQLIPFYIPKEFSKPTNDIYNYALITIDQKKDILYVGSFSGGVYMIDLNTKQLLKHLDFSAENPLLNYIKDIKEQPNSPYILIATSGGLIKFNTNTNSSIVINNNLSDNSSIISNNLLYLFIDKTKNLWVGSEDNGLGINLDSYRTFAHYKNGKEKDDNIINCFLEINQSNILVGCNNGLYEFNRNTNTFHNHLLVDKSNPITVQSLFKNKDGNIWIGTISQGLFIYNPQTNKISKILESIFESVDIYKIINDPSGTIWVGTYNFGLFAINPNTLEVKNYTIKDGLSSKKILSLFYDTEKSNLWVCTGDGGICILDFLAHPNKPNITTLKHSDSKNSISSDIVNNIRKDKDGLYWIATTNGLNSYNSETKQFQVFTEIDGLSNNYVYDAIPDDSREIWLPTNNGLSKFDTKTKNENNSAFKSYTTTDGLQSKEVNQGATLLCSDGFILVGGLNGFNCFNPKTIKENKLTPNSFIYSFSRQGKEIITDTSILLKKYIELPYKENYFTFEIIAPEYASSDKIKFMYKLEGKDHEWSSPSQQRIISYTELSGGTYTFKVKASNSNGIWNENPYEITIHVIPPWYKTTWFYILSIISVLALIIGFTNYRTNTIKKENKRLENKVNERTKELAEKNKDITSSIQYAKRIQEAILPAKELIYASLKKSFILYKPKDIVSGDFYWYGEKDELKIIAAVDCTGHGVPGAFMSMIGHNLLNQIVSEKGNYDPGKILVELHKGVQSALKQNQSDNNDGMDVSIVAINILTNEIRWAGAFRSLVVVTKSGELEKIEGNKYPIGGSQLNSEREFTTHVKQLQESDTMYLFSDGFADQFGGEKGKKFMVKKFHQDLLSIHHLNMDEQKNRLEKYFNDWKGNYEQVDDVLVIGIKV